jgi:hypothetical protein
MAIILYFIACVLLIKVHFVIADTCSAVEALGYINVTRPLDFAYIEEQLGYCQSLRRRHRNRNNTATQCR